MRREDPENKFPCPECESEEWVFKGYDYTTVRMPMIFECGYCGYIEKHSMFNYSVNGSQH